MTAGATVDGKAEERAPTYESNLPEWQQWFNRFAENWIFAFIVAMAVRHFGIEFFRIPTASMEPMLYGDPGFSHSDHVAVDKLVFRFRGLHRWDVAVFQFPQAEVEVDGQPVSARDAFGNNLEKPLIRPLMYRNFVKRVVIMPGDKFYVANGDIFLQQPDQSWQVARKPAKVQEAMWADIYQHGALTDYKPWKANQPAIIDIKKGDGHLVLGLQDNGSVSFEQPLRNLYIKEGIALVHPKVGDKPDVKVQVSLTKPEFTYPGMSVRGNIWDYERWVLTRLNSEDLDNVKEGARAPDARALNKMMDEWVGDVRVIAKIEAIQEHAVLCISEGKERKVNDLQLHLYPAGWQLENGAQILKKGDASVVGKTISFASLDDQVIFAIGSDEQCRADIAQADPQVAHTAIAWRGNGTLELSALTIQRDVHYSANMGFAHNEADFYNEKSKELAAALHDPSVDPRALNSTAKSLADIRGVRAQMLGIPVEDLKPEQCYQRIGYSPATAITAPADAYLMLGDNSPLSWDGRCWGWVPERNFRGRALAVVLPPRRWKIIH
jgi:signal peptidase I